MVTKVENDRHCQAFLQHEFPSTCLFADALGLITNTVPERKLMDPNKIVFRKNAHCVTHGRTCEFEMKGKLCVMGPPCVLFSRLIGSILIMFKVYMFFPLFQVYYPTPPSSETQAGETGKVPEHPEGSGPCGCNGGPRKIIWERA